MYANGAERAGAGRVSAAEGFWLERGRRGGCSGAASGRGRSCGSGDGRRREGGAEDPFILHTHTGERLEATYCCNGRYEPEAPSLLDLLHELGGTLETDAPFHIIAGVNP